MHANLVSQWITNTHLNEDKVDSAMVREGNNSPTLHMNNRLARKRMKSAASRGAYVSQRAQTGLGINTSNNLTGLSSTMKNGFDIGSRNSTMNSPLMSGKSITTKN